MIKNLVSGLKVAFFLKCEAKDFRISYTNLWFIVLVHGIIIFTFDYFYVTKPATFSYYGLRTEGFTVVCFLFAAFITSKLFSDDSLQLSVPVLSLNGWLAPITLGKALLLSLPALFSTGADQKDIHYLLNIWVIIIFFRVMLLLSNAQALRQIIGTALLFAAFYVPTSYYYGDSFWYEDYEAQKANETSQAINSEETLEQQYILLHKQLDNIQPRKPGKNMFVVTFAGDGEQDLFMKEATFATKVLDEKYHITGHSLALVNNTATYKDLPLATTTNLNRALQTLGQKAKVEDDALLLFLTSHGGKNGSVLVDLADMDLNQLTTTRLKTILSQSKFKWKIIIISSCYSGKFIDALKDDNTLIITSARADRTSFGCGDESDLTYFGDAYFKQALPKSDGFIPAFDSAKKIIAKMEDDQKSEPHSEPQIYVGSAIRHYLEEK